MAKIYVVNKELDSKVVVGTQTLDFTKHLVVLDSEKDDALIAKLKSFNASLGYEVLDAQAFKAKYMQKEEKQSQEEVKQEKPQTEPDKDLGDKQDETTQKPAQAKQEEDPKKAWKEKQEKVKAQKEILKKLKAEWDSIADDDEEAEKKRADKQAEIDAATAKLKEIQA